MGINTFKHFPSAALQGCVNDANQMSDLFQRYMQFDPSEVTVLTEEDATKRRIMSALEGMVERAASGELAHLAFSISSHGTQVPDEEGGDEKDRPVPYDEAFVPHDLRQAGNDWHRDFIIKDDELNALFDRVPPHVLVEVYLDTCHAGTGLKTIDFMLERKPRFLPPPSYEAVIAAQRNPNRNLVMKMQNSKTQHAILWAACRANQTSSDARIDGDFHGAFTYYLCREIDACQNRVPRKEILKRVRADLKAEHFTQVPQLELDATRRNLPLGNAGSVAGGENRAG